MPKIFTTLDKIKPAYDITYKVVLFICKLLLILDILADAAVMVLGIIMMVVGWNYATTLGGRGFYVSMPWLSRFWMYFPVPLAGVAMVVFEFESIYNHIKSLFVKEEN